MSASPLRNNFTRTLPPALSERYAGSNDVLSDMLFDFLALKQEPHPPQLLYQFAECLLEARVTMRQLQYKARRRKHKPYVSQIAAIDEALKLKECHSVYETERQVSMIGNPHVRIVTDVDVVYISPYLLTTSF
jgi:hypothetical protein